MLLNRNAELLATLQHSFRCELVEQLSDGTLNGILGLRARRGFPGSGDRVLWIFHWAGKV